MLSVVSALFEGDAMAVKRGVIVAKIKPGSEEAVAKLFAESDESELPKLAGVRHRSLFVLDDVYIHLVELDDDFADTVDEVRDHPLFKDISRRLDEYITPYDPETWKSPKDAQAREFYSWDPPDSG
jgi:cyclase